MNYTYKNEIINKIVNIYMNDDDDTYYKFVIQSYNDTTSTTTNFVLT
jgi:hypothetical protein